MATAEQRSRRAAQRATAKAVRAARAGQKYQPRVPRAIRQRAFQGQIDYATRVLQGKEPEPTPDRTSPESRELARVASYADHGKADERFVGAFSKHWYHKAKDQGNEADIEDESDYEEEDEDEE